MFQEIPPDMWYIVRKTLSTVFVRVVWKCLMIDNYFLIQFSDFLCFEYEYNFIFESLDLVSVFPTAEIIHSEYFYFSHTYELRKLTIEGKLGLTVTYIFIVEYLNSKNSIEESRKHTPNNIEKTTNINSYIQKEIKW